ncbi:MAG: 30S ribosomal protein S2 [Candidatus Pacebacteria bacterium]|nr:30S ribosomal protein S2 [Candidatus Paceibacterota bacterium]
MIATTKEKKTNLSVNPDEMLEAGLQFGHKTSTINPKIKPYLFGVRNGVYLFDLDKTAEKLKEALDFISTLILEGKNLLLVGTKIQIKKILKETAEECGLPYINERWLGGTFTNFETIKKRIEYFRDLEAKKESGELEKYTKKEKAKFDHELARLSLSFGGVKNLTSLPEAIFVVDMKKDALCIKESKIKGIKIIAIADTNVDPTLADYPIPANDDAISSVKYILEKLKETVLKNRSKKTVKEEKPVKK